LQALETVSLGAMTSVVDRKTATQAEMASEENKDYRYIEVRNLSQA
jgi:hypothetical protein